MIDELNNLLEKWNIVDEYKILQIKEKYGSLRWYDGGLPHYMHDEYYKWLSKYEKLSEETCIICGDKSTHFQSGYVVPLCDRCSKK